MAHDETIESGVSSLSNILQKYLATFPHEADRLREFGDFLSGRHGDRVIDRFSFRGHVTASAVVLSRFGDKALLKYSEDYRMFLQPGCHMISQDATPLDTARRALAAKAGFSSLEYIPLHSDLTVPIDIDTHTIPENPALREEGHLHHDFRYLFLADECAVEGTYSEAHGYRWFDITELARYESLSLLTLKLQNIDLADVAVRRFYDTLITHFASTAPYTSIVVTHLLPGTIQYLNALSRTSRIAAVIPKPTSIVASVSEAVSAKFKVFRLTRQEIASGRMASYLSEISDDRVVIFDIGGYFAPIAHLDDFSKVVTGIIEDTENGHQRYERIQGLKIPIISVARSPLKDNEDFLVGQAVVFSADAVLRNLGRLLHDSHIGILGFGKIGRSILYHLLQRNVVPYGFDRDPIRTIQAHNIGAQACSLEVLLRSADVIFSATGNKALNIMQLKRLKPGCIIFSVTSSDDELDLRNVSSEYVSEEVVPFVTRFKASHNHFYLVNNGNAVNFIHGAVLGNIIHLVRAEMIAAASSLVTDKVSPGLSECPQHTREWIARWWLKAFNVSGTLFDH